MFALRNLKGLFFFVLVIAIFYSAILLKTNSLFIWGEYTRNSSKQPNKLRGAKLASSTTVFTSAYFDSRLGENKTKIRVLGYRLCKFKNKSFVATINNLQTLDEETVILKPISLKSCPWKWASECKAGGFSFESNYLLHNFSQNTPINLKISTKKSILAPAIFIDKILKIHPVLKNFNSWTYENTLAVCVTTVYLYAHWLELVQWLELWRQIKAEKVYIYTVSVSISVSKIMEAYEKQGFVERIPWPIGPTTSNVTKDDLNHNLFQYEQVLAHQDCILRNIGKSKFLAMVDFDEIIMPKSDNKFDLIKILEKLLKKTPTAGAFVFRQRRLEYPMEFYNLPDQVKIEDITFSYLTKMHQGGDFTETKYIVRPETLHIASIHTVNLIEKFRLVWVSRTLGEVYHLKRKLTDKNHRHFPIDMAEQIRKYKKIDFLDDKTVKLMEQRFKNTVSSIFLPNSTIKHENFAIWVMGYCLKPWRKYGCKIAHVLCDELLFGSNSTEWESYSFDNGYKLPYL